MSSNTTNVADSSTNKDHEYNGSIFLSSKRNRLPWFKKADLSLYRLQTRIEAMYRLARLSKEEVDAFHASYTLFEGGTMQGKDEQQIIDYYNVLNK